MNELHQLIGMYLGGDNSQFCLVNVKLSNLQFCRIFAHCGRTTIERASLIPRRVQSDILTLPIVVSNQNCCQLTYVYVTFFRSTPGALVKNAV